MLKYYGTPLTPKSIFDEVMPTRNSLIPFPNPQNLNRALIKCEKVIVDNGAFTLWRKGGDIDWDKYYAWLRPFVNNIEFYFIPDVIDGTEEENDALIADYFTKEKNMHKGVPIWHINESFERLERLMDNFDYIAIGSAGEFSQLGTPQWENQMDKAMRKICCTDGYPKVKIHMLRCLDPKIFTRFPFHSGDSTALAQNHSRDGWRHIVKGIEKYNSPDRYEFRNFYEQKTLFCEGI